MEKCEEFIGGKGRGDRKTFESLTGSSSNSDTEVKLDTETGSESEEVGTRNSRIKYDRGVVIGPAKSHLSTSSRSGITRRSAGDSGPTKRRDNLRLYSVDSKSPISASFSTHSWSSMTSRETGEEKEKKEEEDEEQEDSGDWETTEDEDEDVVEVKVVCDSQKIAFRSEALTG